METQMRTLPEKLAHGILKARWAIFVLFALALTYGVLSMGRVKTNSDLTAFLPDSSETRQGLKVMQEEFGSFSSAAILLKDVTKEEARDFAVRIGQTPGVTNVSYDESEDHYKEGKAFYTVLFSGANGEERTALDAIRKCAGEKEILIDGGTNADYSEKLAGEMTGVLLISAAVIAAVLLLTSRSYFEIVIMAVVFAVAAVLNMGTNFWLGEISSITHSVAVILQLALAIDYAIIFAHRYQDEAAKTENVREALEKALARSIVEIASSSLTTVSGLAALMLMQFKLGYDLGVVLSKGILFSMLTVFLLMPGLISLFPRALKKTAHKNLVPPIRAWGRFLGKSRGVFAWIFLLILIPAVLFAGKVDYAFSDGKVTEIIPSEARTARREIENTFSPATSIALLVPAGDAAKEKAVLKKLDSIPQIQSVTALAGVTFDGVHSLADTLSAKEAAALFGVPEEQAENLFALYSFQQGRKIEKATIGELALFFAELAETGAIGELPQGSDGMLTLLSEKEEMLKTALSQLQGKTSSRMVLSALVPAEGEEAVALQDAVRAAAEEEYGKEGVFLVGNITSASDLAASYTGDSRLIGILTALFVFLILLVSFRSLGAALVLVFVIQGSVWINFAFAYLFGDHPSFVTQMIVSAIQMGATIDYAIVFLSRFLERRKTLPKKEALAEAVSDAFPTIITSGSIMSAAGFLIAFRVSDVYVGHIGLAVGRGALISVILVLTVLPQLVLLLEGFIEKTTLKIGKKEKKKV